MLPRKCAAVAAVVIGTTIAGPAAAQAQQAPQAPPMPQVPSHCFAIAEATPGVHYVAYVPAAAEAPDVTITYANHSTFRIESPEGVIIATDYAGYYGRGRAPDVATMNHAHSSHFTNYPDPAITHVLRGWNPEGGPAEHHLEVGDVMVRNVPTDIRRGGFVEPFGNSIFIFEIAGLCIGHLGHLHHEPTDSHYAAIGRLDVVMVAVDGSYTMAQMNVAHMLERMRTRLVLPMHYFGIATLTNFISNLGEGYIVQMRQSPTITVSLATLPEQPTVVVLPPS